MAASESPLTEPITVFVTVGTDLHPFNRMSEWVDRWLGDRGETPSVRCLCQTGTSVHPERAEHSDYLTFEAMAAAMRAATVIITHGGPATIMQAVAIGKRPIVVPRSRALGEHVDDHQRAFARRIARDGSIMLVEDEREFRACLDGVLSGRRSARVKASSGVGPDATIRRFERLVDGLFAPQQVTGPPGTVVDLAQRPRP